VQIAAQHAETESAGSRQGVEERLLFNGVATGGIDVSEGGVECSSLIVSDLANARESRGNGAAVTAREALHTIAIQRAVQERFADLESELFRQRGHRNL
jgi:hypothetical protein